MYFCTIDAAGDTTGDSDSEVILIVYRKLLHVVEVSPNTPNVFSTGVGNCAFSFQTG